MNLNATMETILSGPLPEQQLGLADLDAQLGGGATAEVLQQLSAFLADPRLKVPENLLNLLIRLGVPNPGKTLESGPYPPNLLSRIGPQLVEWLAESDPRIRGRASAALGWCLPAPATAADRLVHIIECERYDDCRAVQGFSLGILEWRAGSSRHRDVLVQLLEQRRSQIRPLAAVAIAFSSPGTAVSDVARALSDLARNPVELVPWLRELPGSLWLACIALGRLPGRRPEAVGWIAKGISQGMFRTAAIRALVEVGLPRANEIEVLPESLQQLANLAPFQVGEVALLEEVGLPSTAEQLDALARRR